MSSLSILGAISGWLIVMALFNSVMRFYGDRGLRKEIRDLRERLERLEKGGIL